jgi:quercetin dioxygenase-like cupin family protein
MALIVQERGWLNDGHARKRRRRSMALLHARPWQAIAVQPLGPALPATATHAILKTHALELMRVVLRAGDSLPPHSVYGDMTLHCLEGEIAVEGEGESCALHAGELVLVPACERYALRAQRDASLLMTVHTPAGRPGSGSSTV